MIQPEGPPSPTRQRMDVGGFSPKYHLLFQKASEKISCCHSSFMLLHHSAIKTATTLVKSSSCCISTFSFTACASANFPGPKMAVGIPARPSQPASVTVVDIPII